MEKVSADKALLEIEGVALPNHADNPSQPVPREAGSPQEVLRSKGHRRKQRAKRSSKKPGHSK